jgi:hypothetical protein
MDMRLLSSETTEKTKAESLNARFEKRTVDIALTRRA